MRYFDYSPMYYHASFWPQGLISLFLNILVWGIIIYLFMHVIKKLSGSSHGCCGSHDRAHIHEEKDDSYYLHIVKERYAKGEIDKKQFEEIKKGLMEDDEPVVSE